MREEEVVIRKKVRGRELLYYYALAGYIAVVLKVGVITPVGVMKPFSGGNESLSKSNSSLK